MMITAIMAARMLLPAKLNQIPFRPNPWSRNSRISRKMKTYHRRIEVLPASDNVPDALPNSLLTVIIIVFTPCGMRA